MAYTRESTGSYSISGSTATDLEITSNRGVTSYNGDNKTYYATITFSKKGRVILKVLPLLTSGCLIAAKVAQSSVSFDTDTGWPRSSDGEGSAINPRTGNVTEVLSTNVTAGTYNFYFRNTYSTSCVFVMLVQFTESTSPDEYEKVSYNIGNISSSVSKTVDQEDYKIYCFQFRALQSGCVIEQTSNTQTTMFLSEYGTDSAFDPATGYVYRGYCISDDYYAMPGPETRIIVPDAGTYYFWIRQEGLGDGTISFTISPPGSTWTVGQLENDTNVGITGASWPENAGKIRDKYVEYIALSFSVAGNYTFSLSSSEQIYGYLASSLVINSNGVPTSILASDQGTSSGFSFSYTVNTSDTYYLMIRTPSGSTNNYGFTLSITSESNNYAYSLQSDQLSIADTRNLSYTLITTSSYCGGIYFKAKFARSTSVTVSITSTYKSTIYVTNADYGFNSNTGAPYTNSSHTTEASGGETQSFTANTTDDYYIWVRGIPSRSSTGIVLEIALGTAYWTYTDRSEITSIDRIMDTPSYELRYHVGSRLRVTFRSSGSIYFKLNAVSGAILYVTGSYTSTESYGFDTSDGVPYTNLSHDKATGGREYTVTVTAGTTYWLWISPGTLSETIQASVTIVPSYVQWTDSQTASITDPSAVQTITFRYQTPYMYYCLVRFADSGTAEFYSDTGMFMSVVSWLTSSYQGINGDTGVPLGTILASDDNGGGFDYTYEVTAGVTYCFWWRPEVKTASGQLTVYVKPPESPTPPTPTNIGFWIGTANGWHKLMIYIGNASRQWVEYKPYIAVGSTDPEWIDEY